MKRRTGLLFSSAVVLGLAGGVAGGFAIQRGRPATPLPPVPHTVVRAAAPAAAEVPDPGSDDGAKLDGDLRKLLLERPSDARDHPFLPPTGWVTIGDLAELYDNPAQALPSLNQKRFRRAAEAAWTTADGMTVEIDLIQFRTTDGAEAYFGDDHGGGRIQTQAVPGTATGIVDHDDVKDRDGNFLGYGFVRHGTVVEEVIVTRKQGPPDNDAVLKITKEQADRL